ncbi:unnamed protein product [Schistosoma margrebowiei]|uniref:Uncharacterized protein n=1 Tax=Schistosoma margrebowiei TaxID=48269 RepID=A0A183MGQ6_9TREM|nr:unnamed protein product [Schistosoma margrebowiei]
MNYFDNQGAIEKIKAVLAETKTPYAFGSCQERSLYPEAIPHHRLGITLAPVNGNGFVGPTTYDIQNSDFPDPGTYQNFVNKSLSVKPNKVPFNQSTCRTNKSLISGSTVGVGTYDITKQLGQHIQWQMDTMLHPVNLPKNQYHSTILMNTDKLNTTIECKRYQRKLAYLKLYYN